MIVGFIPHKRDIKYTKRNFKLDKNYKLLTITLLININFSTLKMTNNEMGHI